MELTLEAVAKDAFRRDLFLRCFSEREAQALELRFAFLHRVRQYKRLVGRRDLLPRAAKDIAASYLQQVEATNQLLLPPGAEPLRSRVLAAVTAGHCPLDLFNGLETLVRELMTREAFPRFLKSKEYTDLCEALRTRRQLPLAAVLVDSRRTQFLMRFLAEEFPGEEGNLRFWAHVQTHFLPLIQTTLFSVALFEEVQRHERHVFNQFLVGEAEGGAAASAATRVPEAVRRQTLQQIMKLQSEAFSPPRYASLFRAAQDCVWEWLQTEVYPKFRASSLYVMLVVETEDLETDQQLRRLSEHVQATVNKSATVRQERQSETIPKVPTRKSEAQLKANAVLVPIKPPAAQNLWGQNADTKRQRFDWVLRVQELARRGIHSISVVELVTSSNSKEEASQVGYRLFCTGNELEAEAETHPTHLNFWMGNTGTTASGHLLSPSERTLQTTPPNPSFHDFVLRIEDGTARSGTEKADGRYLFGVCLALWRQKSTPTTSSDEEPGTSATDTIEKQDSPQFLVVLTTEPTHKKSRRLLLQLASISMDTVTADTVSQFVASICEPSTSPRHLLRAKYGGFCLQPNLRAVDVSLSSAFKEISSQTFISILASVLVGKSIILVSERPAALISVAEAARELLKPFEWLHFYLPFCPVTTSSELHEAGLFSEANTSPFLLGCEGSLTYQKKDSGADQRFRIRNSIYTTHKVSLQLQAPATTSREYPPELLQTTAIVIDIDSDDIYVPEKVEIPELPQSLLRSLESMLNAALHSSHVVQADSHLFGSSKTPDFISEILEPSKVLDSPVAHEEPTAEVAPSASPSLCLDDRARLALLWFLEALFGDVVYYFCSFHQNFAVETQPTSADADEFILFEVDSFLDAHTELGCRDFFRQFFHTQLFRRFMLAQHAQFSFPSAREALKSSETTLDFEAQRDSPPDAFI